MSESLIAIINYGFNDLKLLKVEAHTYSNNVRAKRLLERLGFHMNNTNEDSDIYRLYREKWEKLDWCA